MADDWNDNFARDPLRQPCPEPAGIFRVSAKRVVIGNLNLDKATFDEAVAWTLNYIENHRGGPPARICCPNASLVVLAEADEAFAEIVRTSDLVVADGRPLLWAAALVGESLGDQIRGVELMEAICAAGASGGLNIYILGGLPGAAELAGQRLLARNPGLRLAGTHTPPIGFENHPAVNRQIKERIIAAAPDFLIVALGSPKQERWIFDNYRDLPVGAIQGVGAAVDTVAGLRKRPPAGMRNLGLEWLGRLLHEPRRLWRRYIFGNARFVYIVYRQWRSVRNLQRRGGPR
jgi:N-acetylglucosaminyldiphosphoundecaprenol N-acetyl-beta-D-mannosaminyltransferase